MEIGWKIAMWAVIIIVGISIYKNGFNNWKADLVGKTFETGKDVAGDIVDTGKNIIDKNKETTTPSTTPTAPAVVDGKTYYGKPLIPTNCITDSDCTNYVEDCDNCKCDLNLGTCYK